MSRIEVAALAEASGASKTKGDLLQEFAREFANTRGFEVVEEVRTATSEIDLDCRDRASGETIYMECKAHRKPLTKLALTNLIGVVNTEDYSAGWLISSGPLSKDAKGIQKKWLEKDLPERAKLRVYSENQLVELLIDAKLVVSPASVFKSIAAKPGHEEPDWVLLITEYGRFWTAPVYQGGMASEIYVVSANDLGAVDDQELLASLSKLDSSWTGKRFVSEPKNSSEEVLKVGTAIPPIVEMMEGARWSDYRPSRLRDFAGRKKELADIFEVLETARLGLPGPRVFAVTGESGIGKSSLLSGVRGKSRQRPNSKKVFSIVIDCRAANSPDYINAALVKGLSKAANAGFGEALSADFHVSNPSHPLSSPDIAQFFETLRSRGQVVCLMFDQFEEIYAKPSLSDVFKAAQDLFLSAVAEDGPLVLGFAWRSNFTGQLDHPAYYMWHSLADHRVEMSLKPLDTSEVNTALTAFEKELGDKLGLELRRQLVEAARGYPWLLKKLCIHLLQQVTERSKQLASVENLSVESLFTKDLSGLTDHERRALQHIAENAPIAAFEVVEGFGEAALKKLEDGRLVSRTGEMLNIYWDIFRDFLLSGSIPDLPFSFLPSSPSIGALLSVADQLHPTQSRTAEQIADPAQLAPRTVSNVIRDLLIIGAAESPYSSPTLSKDLRPSDPKSVMRCARNAMSKHTLLRALEFAKREGSFTEAEISDLLATIPSIPDYDEANLLRQVKKLTTWFAATGFLQRTATGWKLADIGEVDLSYAEKSRSRAIGPFNGGSTPTRALELLQFAAIEGSLDPTQAQKPGYPKAFNTLSRFGLIVNMERAWRHVAPEGDEVGSSPVERLLKAALKQESLIATVRLLKENPTIGGPALAEELAKDFNENWSEGSLKRTGNALKRWGQWMLECEREGEVIEPKEGVKGRVRGDTPETMAKIHEMLSAGKTQKAIAQELGYSTAAIGKWLKEEQALQQT